MQYQNQNPQQPRPQQPPQQYQPSPQQPQYQQPPPVYYQPVQVVKQGRSPVVTCLIILLILIVICCCLSVIGGLIFGIPAVGEVQQYIEDLLGTNITLPFGNPGMATGQGSITVNSAEGGVLTSPDGAMVSIPPAAVPQTEAGDVGQMVFSISERANDNPQLPEGYESTGTVYELGPEGFTFTVPVTVSLPIPEDVNIDGIMGVAYYDPSDSTWKMIPGYIDQENRTVSAQLSHFSIYTPFGHCINTFGVCDYYDSVHEWKTENGAFVEIHNNHLYNTGTYPGESDRHLPYSLTYGVCIESYSLDNPDIENRWTKPNDWKMTVSDYYFPHGAREEHPPVDWWVPAGTYNLIEVASFSEVNSSPMYMPEYTTYWRTLGPYDLRTGQTYDFSSSGLGNFDTWSEGRPPCYGIEDTSVGTGDVQVTLTWEANIDLDLYVVEPNGEEIYYGYSPSTTGGQLDRDNLCSNMVIGRPENIYWPSGAAPSGTYTVKVNYYGACETDMSVNYTVRVVVMGNTQTYTGTISSYDTQTVTTFSVP